MNFKTLLPFAKCAYLAGSLVAVAIPSALLINKQKNIDKLKQDLNSKEAELKDLTEWKEEQFNEATGILDKQNKELGDTIRNLASDNRRIKQLGSFALSDLKDLKSIYFENKNTSGTRSYWRYSSEWYNDLNKLLGRIEEKLSYIK